jgi:hypothetical protein
MSSSTPVVPVETPQEKLNREIAELEARKVADARYEAELARVAAEKEAYAKSPEGQRAAARERELVLQANREFLTAHPEFSDTDENAAQIRAFLRANQLTWSAENLATAYEAQWKAGRLTPKPFVPPPADAPKAFDTRGLTRAKINAMPPAEYRRLIASPSGKAIVDYVFSGGK